jgi:hypothetical protein
MMLLSIVNLTHSLAGEYLWTLMCRKARRGMGSECEAIKQQLNLYRLGKLTEAEKAEVESHMLVCPECIFLLTLVPAYNQD